MGDTVIIQTEFKIIGGILRNRWRSIFIEIPSFIKNMGEYVFEKYAFFANVRLSTLLDLNRDENWLKAARHLLDNITKIILG